MLLTTMTVSGSNLGRTKPFYHLQMAPFNCIDILANHLIPFIFQHQLQTRFNGSLVSRHFFYFLSQYLWTSFFMTVIRHMIQNPSSHGLTLNHDISINRILQNILLPPLCTLRSASRLFVWWCLLTFVIAIVFVTGKHPTKSSKKHDVNYLIRRLHVHLLPALPHSSSNTIPQTCTSSPSTSFSLPSTTSLIASFYSPHVQQQHHLVDY